MNVTTEPQASTRRRNGLLCLIVVAVLIACLWLGGWPWLLIGLLVLPSQVNQDWRLQPMVEWIVPGLFWLTLFVFTANRELYFPFTIGLVVWLLLDDRSWLAWVLAISGIAIFTTVRLLESATTNVLIVELFVILAVLSLAIMVYWSVPKHRLSRLGIAIGASVIACVSLLL